MAQANKLTELGLEKNKIILDPGIGFGKTTNHNLEILNNLEIFSSLGFNTLLGASRKGFSVRFRKKITLKIEFLEPAQLQHLASLQE